MTYTSSNAEHPISISREGGTVTVELDGVRIAESRDALVLKEAGYPPVHYIPKTDVDMARLTPTPKTTTCPYKGEARYWSVAAQGTQASEAAWAYDHPKPGVREIAGHLAFYPEKVRITVTLPPNADA